MSGATEQDARNRLLEALRAVGECCYPPLQEAMWPSSEQLYELDSAVAGLAKMGRKRAITVLTPYWKAYEHVNKLRPEIRLLPRVKELVKRADELLKEAGESDLTRLKRKASAGASEARQLVGHLRTIQEDASNAGKIEWEDYESLLGDKRPFRLPYGDSAPRDVRCYVRALQLIVDDLPYRRLHDEAFPLLVWITGIGSPYAEMLKHNHVAQYCADYMASRRAEATKKRKQEQWKLRKRRQRLKELEAFLRAEGISEGELQKILAANA
jgi:hypothetical protein